MGIRNTRESWGLVHRLIHWTAAGVILFQLGLGFWMVNVVSDVYEQFALTQTHKSWGFVAFALAAVRLAWRRANPRPALPAGMTRIEVLAAEGAHVALYALMVLLPVTGWLMASASPLQDQYGIRNMVFGLFELPDPFVPGNAGLANWLASVHAWAAFGIAVLVAIHAGAALKHHFVERDGLLMRMVLGTPARTEAQVTPASSAPDASRS